MVILIDNPGKIMDVDGVKCRVWEGTTDNGISCTVFVHRIAISKQQVHPDFDTHLLEVPPTSSLELTMRGLEVK